jgi:hypothetical protein
MKRPSSQWFINVRGSYLPASWQGWVLYIPYLAYLVGVPIYVWQHQLSLGSAILTLIPNWVAALVVMTWVAERTSKSDS